MSLRSRALSSSNARGSTVAKPFPLADVRLLDGPFRDAMLRDQKYLLSLDADRLLHTFRLNVRLAVHRATTTAAGRPRTASCAATAWVITSRRCR